MVIKNFLIIAQVLVSFFLIVLITLQGKGGGLGTAFGASQALYSQRRGVERLVFYTTVFLVFLFLLISIANLLLPLNL